MKSWSERKAEMMPIDSDMHEKLIGPVCDLAELSTSTETPGVARDPEMDALIMAARRIKEREGYEVEAG